MADRMTRTLLAMALLAGALPSLARAQDQEEGPVDLNANDSTATTSDNAASASGGAQISTSGAAGWGEVYQPPARSDDDEERNSDRSDSSGASKSAVGAFRVYGGLRFDVGGGFTTWQDRDWIHRAAATPAIQLGADYVVWDYLAVGVQTGLGWSRVTDSDTRVMLWDLVLKPRARYQLSGSGLEVYGAMPFGVTIPNYPEPKKGAPDITGKASGTLGLMGGVFYFFGDHLGVNAEMGWLWHWVKADYEEVENTPAGPKPIGEKTQRLGQFTILTANLVYAF